jgi:hypothetical protein
MNSTSTTRGIALGYLLAGLTLCLGVFLGTKAGENGGQFLKGFYWLSVLIVIKVTFDWGRLRGYSWIRENGTLAVSHIVRCVVMCLLAWVSLLLIFAPLTMAAFKLARL